jgi:hypothetical protein
MSLNSLPWYKVIIKIISKVDTSYRVIIGYFLQCTYLDFIQMSFVTLGEKGKWVFRKHLYYVYEFLCKDYHNDKFIHTTTYTYNKVMQLLEFAYIVEQE